MKLKLKVDSSVPTGEVLKSPLPKSPKEPKQTPSDDFQTCPQEEHLILRVLNKQLAKQLHSNCRARVQKNINFKFTGKRTGNFQFIGNSYATSLVDLPCIVESMKDFDGVTFHKTADISQMLVVQDQGKPPIMNTFKPSELTDEKHAFPHGITPPMKYVRKRRFRQRISKRAIEDIETELIRLLEADLKSELHKYEVIDGPSEVDDFDDDNPDYAANTQDLQDFDANWPDIDEMIGDALENDTLDNLFDSNAAPYNLIPETNDVKNTGSDEESDDDDDSDDGIALEDQIIIQALGEEIADLEQRMMEKVAQMDGQVNAIMKQRFSDIVKRLQVEIENKKEELENIRNTSYEEIEEEEEEEGGGGSEAGGEEKDAGTVDDKELSEDGLDDMIDNIVDEDDVTNDEQQVMLVGSSNLSNEIDDTLLLDEEIDGYLV